MAVLDAARARAQAVLRIRALARAAAVLPAAIEVVLLAGRWTGRIGAPGAPDATGWDAARWVVGALAVLTVALALAAVHRHASAVPPSTPAVAVLPEQAPELYRTIQELADRLGVPVPAAIALTPDCDSWLEDEPAPPPSFARTLRTLGSSPLTPHPPAAQLLVIGSPFLWWMRADELRALLAPVVAGTAAAADPEIAAARRFVRGLDAALGQGRRTPQARLLDRITRLLLKACREHVAELERAAAAAASERAKAVDYGLRIAAQGQVGLAYAGWDRLLTRVALPAWRLGRCPAQLNAGVVAALTELSRRDRLAEGYESRLGDRPACDLLEEPGDMDTAVSLLAAELFHGPVPGGQADLPWDDYPEQVVDRGWRLRAIALQEALDTVAPPGSGPVPGRAPGRAGAPTLDRLLERLAAGGGEELARALAAQDGAAALLCGGGERGGRELLADCVTAMVCCAAVDSAGAHPGLDWLDGPVLLLGGVRRGDLADPVVEAVEQGRTAPLRNWLQTAGVHLEKPVRLG
ncbi:hypothetical protein OG500_19565 [Kitasatospora sp. NBC_01250]|uniref:hypothetical protein n=1 Tax=unclassified Kitasatospora TaxID=2633591 RepID=UPI002E110533|nr:MULTISPECIES: hypothetical protein [unclassified Kitasatospora]WSJ68278.1 hypothetical protein OG294_20355 [Kitasatospora sp. NBC_01302]